MGEARPPGARLVEVEQRRRGNVVVQWAVSPTRLPAEGLDLDTQVVGEMDGVWDMPAVQTEALLALVEAVGRITWGIPRYGVVYSV